MAGECTQTLPATGSGDGNHHRLALWVGCLTKVAGPWITAALILMGALATNPVDVEGCHGNVGLFMVTVILRIIPAWSVPHLLFFVHASTTH